MIASRATSGSRHLWRKVTTTNGCCRSIFSATPRLLEKITVKVPTMGDSITEVSVAALLAYCGLRVKLSVRSNWFDSFVHISGNYSGMDGSSRTDSKGR